MFNFSRLCVGLLARCFRSRRRLLLENLALRQQLAVLKRRQPRPTLLPFDKLFWVLACRFWSDWKKSLLVVTPETVVRWHRTGFRLWRRTQPGGLLAFTASFSCWALTSPREPSPAG